MPPVQPLFRTAFERERAAYKHLTKQGYEVVRRGFPDLIAFNPVTKEIRFIEVKAICDKLKPQQEYVRSIFEQAGMKFEIARVGQADGDYMVVEVV